MQCPLGASPPRCDMKTAKLFLEWLWIGGPLCVPWKSYNFYRNYAKMKNQFRMKPHPIHQKFLER
jgi:hypothetical protein